MSKVKTSSAQTGETAALIQALPWQIIFECYLQKDVILASRVTCKAMEARSYDLSLHACTKILLEIYKERGIHPAWHKFHSNSEEVVIGGGHQQVQIACGDDETLIRGWLLSSIQASRSNNQGTGAAKAFTKEGVTIFTSSYFYRMLHFARVSKCFPKELFIFGNAQHKHQQIKSYLPLHEDIRLSTDPLTNLSCPICQMESSLHCGDTLYDVVENSHLSPVQQTYNPACFFKPKRRGVVNKPGHSIGGNSIKGKRTVSPSSFYYFDMLESRSFDTGQYGDRNTGFNDALRPRRGIKYAMSVHCAACRKFSIVTPSYPCGQLFAVYRDRCVTKHARFRGEYQQVKDCVTLVRAKCASIGCSRPVPCQACCSPSGSETYIPQCLGYKCQRCQRRYCNDCYLQRKKIEMTHRCGCNYKNAHKGIGGRKRKSMFLPKRMMVPDEL